MTNFQKDENIIAENCLTSYATNKRTSTKSALSGKSGGSKAGPGSEAKYSVAGSQATSVGDVRTASVEDRMRVLRRKHAATLMVRLLTAVQKGSKVRRGRVASRTRRRRPPVRVIRRPAPCASTARERGGSLIICAGCRPL